MSILGERRQRPQAERRRAGTFPERRHSGVGDDRRGTGHSHHETGVALAQAPLLNLANTFVDLADPIEASFSPADHAARLARACGSLARAAGLLLVDPDGVPQVAAVCPDEPELVTLLGRLAIHEPALHLSPPGRVLALPDAPAEPGDGPWAVQVLPMLQDAAQDASVVGVVCLLTGPQGLPSAELQILQALTTVATAMMVHHRAREEAVALSSQLQEALTSRVVIEQAKGVLAEAGRLSMAEAFGALRTYARNRNLRLRDVAQAVVSGALPSQQLTGAPLKPVNGMPRARSPRA